MKNICFYFQIHQPFRLKRYRFFEIGKDHYYYDDFNNENTFSRIAESSYRPAIHAIKEMIESSNKQFKAAFSISGVALEQFEIYAPEIIDQLKDLVKTGCVEILGETYAHSLSSLSETTEFRKQVVLHSKKINEVFGVTPKVFRNTELIYSDEIAWEVSQLGFNGMIAEGAKHILGWKSPNYMYKSAVAGDLKLLLRNFRLSDDITFNFSNTRWAEYPLNADKYLGWIKDAPDDEKIFNLFMNFDTFGNIQPAATGIFEFLKAIPVIASKLGISFATPSDLMQQAPAIDNISAQFPFSWADEDRGTTAWLGNRLQKEAFEKLYSIAEKVHLCRDRRIKQDWLYLQSSDHFYYMSTKHASDGSVLNMFNPYDSPFEAFTNYMNILSDFIDRVNAQFPAGVESEELHSLLHTIHNQADEIEVLKRKLEKLDTVGIDAENSERKSSDSPKKEKAVKVAKVSNPKVEKAPKTKTKTPKKDLEKR